ncbi:lysylphosphatidylglycerol synthase transmembrane domain-containing protein [Pseudotamlana carrageenivorans]|uniref:TIGR00374 family protein n=1 Tax=Pseudotamlana carrageenivorans TaxID=2069432 RepID=A0A2I7SFS6_9FLAO|nr:lysylphosphatidylglycerol synthase transmembrane domain-containing protein [Tamlana carrageenivorans]AUS04747.1 TIGR00374 family protein [Tamlana carrageenivorans]
MNQKIKNLLKVVLPLLLGVFLIWYSLSKVSIDKLLVYAQNANYSWIVLGMFLGLLSHISRAYRWRFMLLPIGYHVKFGNTFMAVFAAYLINYTIPRAGEVARASLLTNYEGVPFEKGFGTIVAERIADMIVMLGIMLITLFLQFDFIYGFLMERFNPLKVIMFMVIGLILFFIMAFFVTRSQSAIAIKIKTFVSGLVEGVLSIFKMRNKWAYIFHTLFIWGMYVLMFYVTTFAISELGVVQPGAVLVGFISASFSIAATNGGIGSYPLAVYAAFALFGIPEEPSIAYGWIMWASQTLVIIVCGGLSLIYLPIYNRKYIKIKG